MHDTILNIGLMIDNDPVLGKIEITVPVVLRLLRDLGIGFDKHSTVNSDTEPTLSICVWNTTDARVHQLAVALSQDCIAVYDMYHREGRLVGPNKDKWGDFNPAFFILPNGTRLGAEA